MIEILSAQKIKIDRASKKEPFWVCEKKDNGQIIIMGLNKYLKIWGQQPKIKKEKQQS